MDKRKIVILGAGPCGIGAAWYLHKKGYKHWMVYEQNPYPGGLSASFRDDKGFTWDIGGHVLFSHYQKFSEFLNEVLGDDYLSHKRNSWIRIFDSWVPYPWDVLGILHWIYADTRKAGKERAAINLIVDRGEVNPETLNYYSLACRLPLETHRARVTGLPRADYVICLSRPQDWHWDIRGEGRAIMGLYAAFKEMRGDFTLVKKFTKPDNALFIFRKSRD